jgi:hypothetical protein
LTSHEATGDRAVNTRAGNDRAWIDRAGNDRAGNDRAGGGTTSVIVPAHNEEQVIGRCLGAILRDATPGEFDVVVVTNGCTDRTADIASSVPGVRVVDCPVASKPAALNVGDREARGFPRLYVDADVEVDTATVRAVAEALTTGGYELAAPTLRFDFTDRPWAVRAYYDTWQRLPYGRDDQVGTGFYGLSERGRARFGDFPDTMAEDFYVHAMVPAPARKAVPGHQFVVHPPLTLRSLVKIQTRMHAANLRNRPLFAEAAADLHASQVRELLRLARRPSLLPQVALYAAVRLTAKAKARWKNRSTTAAVWDRDTTARATAATGAR